MKRFKTSPLQMVAHIAAWVPLVWLAFDLGQGNLGPEPIREATLRTGKAALSLLIASLACTPINTLFGFRQVLRLRRPLGLYSFMYAALHYAIFIGVDYGFNFSLLQEALLEKRYALAGLAAGTILLLLAVTSTQGWQRRLRKNWKRLHRLVYLAAALAVIHFIWLVKQGVLEPWLWAGALLLLLGLRLPYVKQKALALQRRRG